MRPFIRYGFVGGVIVTGYFVAVLLLTIFNPWLVTGTALGWLAFPAYLLMDAVDALGSVILGRVGVYVLEGLIAFAIGFLGGVSVQNVLLLIRGMDGKGKRGRCPKCGYDLRGKHDAGCPECGWNREAERASGGDAV